VEDKQLKKCGILKLWEEKSVEKDFQRRTPFKNLSMAAKQFNGWKLP
jgi:hypothetical protein